jgi:hypothetical protein
MDYFMRAEVTLPCLLFFILGASSALAGLKLARIDSDGSLRTAIAQLDEEIGVLKLKESELVQRKTPVAG